MPKYSSQIVGMYHHPPANGILRAAPHDCPLVLRPEPTNPYDANAIQVWLISQGIPPSSHQKLTEELQGFGITLKDFLESPEWMLGFIPRIVAAIISVEDRTPGTLVFDANGKPLVIFQSQQIV